MGEKHSVPLTDQWQVETPHLNSHTLQYVPVRFLVTLRRLRRYRDHVWVKLNNLDPFKSNDSTICLFSVIALTPISVNGLVHLNVDGISRWYLPRGSGVKQRKP